MKLLNGYKTYIIMVAMLMNAVVMFSNGDTAGAIQLSLEAFGLGGLRHGIETTGINPQIPLKL